MSTYPLLEVAGAGSAQAKLDEDTQMHLLLQREESEKNQM